MPAPLCSIERLGAVHEDVAGEVIIYVHDDMFNERLPFFLRRRQTQWNHPGARWLDRSRMCWRFSSFASHLPGLLSEALVCRRNGLHLFHGHTVFIPVYSHISPVGDRFAHEPVRTEIT